MANESKQRQQQNQGRQGRDEELGNKDRVSQQERQGISEEEQDTETVRRPGGQQSPGRGMGRDLGKDDEEQ